jgi:hypothetical protein
MELALEGDGEEIAGDAVGLIVAAHCNEWVGRRCDDRLGRRCDEKFREMETEIG